MEAAPRTQVKNEFDRFNKRRILKSSIVFGANASGKSNILKALGTFRNLILKEDKLKNPFPTYAGNGNPIYLSVTLLKEAVTYRYSVRYSMDTIHVECVSLLEKRK
ncbi:ATP-binding protein [Streptococcus uberis]|uniref:AAA family ATPase n=1 Tax=Streptococcus uberis TaxID=1349 RepID=UPI0027DE9364|nr:AAA family ATPase [Streptococcus uberis]MCK1239066.1 ATP-binding protein [Streptococcus uberis]